MGDPEQRQVVGVRHPAQGPQDGVDLHWQLDRRAGDVQARLGAVHGHVPPQGLPPLVHWRGHGRDGVHGGRVEHERPRFRVPAVPGRHRRGGGRVRRGRGRHDVSTPTHFLHLCRTPASFPCITTLLLLLACCSSRCTTCLYPSEGPHNQRPAVVRDGESGRV